MDIKASHLTSLRLVWVYPDLLHEKLDAATWLNPVRELRTQNWEVDLLVPGPVSSHEIWGVSVTRIYRPEIYLIRQIIFHLNVLRFIWREWSNIDIVLFHAMSAPWLLPLRLLRKFRKTKLQLVMDTRTVHMEPAESEPFKARLRRWLSSVSHTWANRWADGQTAVTLRMAQALGIPDHLLWGCWANGVQLELFSGVQTVRRWPTENETIRLIYIGSLHVERNLMSFCKAVANANAAGGNFHLSLIGNGTEWQALEAFAHKHPDWVRLMPSVPHHQIPELLAEAHIGVLPFPDEEKFRVSSPIKLFEYMAAGMPILATKIVCHTDVVGSGSYVFWAMGSSVQELQHSLEEIRTQWEHLPQMGGEASITAIRWTWANSALKLKKALLKGRSPSTQDRVSVEEAA
jgi:glycosyltransferase involved in cell wall biosynthesis